jgi:hypothetical protein
LICFVQIRWSVYGIIAYRDKKVVGVFVRFRAPLQPEAYTMSVRLAFFFRSVSEGHPTNLPTVFRPKTLDAFLIDPRPRGLRNATCGPVRGGSHGEFKTERIDDFIPCVRRLMP